MPIDTDKRPSNALRRVLGVAVLGLALPLAACGTGSEPSEPTSSTAAEPSTPSDSADSAAPDPTGRWSSPEAGDPFLEFSEDGQVKGSDGCNRIETTWEVDGDKILITPFTTTQKACAGVDMWLSEASSATIEGDVMKIADSGGDVVGGLEKEDQ
ncbi:META domain-containing protein [Brevibacterium marinum]|uniref:Heat shock protein HslJ n=1 Tax=Brevibacterium marinum TaxID=418643 RepID=A0A846S4A0_9MICO|nr:META domain-containing protein [Brevibacterium marinum]NJC57833.1 heat shock protein HslJ [Brevibacterium marinum]